MIISMFFDDKVMAQELVRFVGGRLKSGYKEILFRQFVQLTRFV